MLNSCPPPIARFDNLTSRMLQSPTHLPNTVPKRQQPRRCPGQWAFFGIDHDAARMVTSSTAPMGTEIRGAMSSLPDAGYYVLAESNSPRPWWVVVDGGPHGGEVTGHAHTDLGHVELARGSTQLLVDAGSTCYSGDAGRRTNDRSLAGHASLMIDDDALAEPRDAFRWRRIAPTPAVSTGTCTSADAPWVAIRYRHPCGVIHERRVLLLPTFGVLVMDHVAGEGRHRLHWRWPLPVPTDRLILDEDRQRVFLDDVQLNHTTFQNGPSSTSPATLQIVDREWSTAYGRSHSGSIIERIAADAALPAVGAFAAVGAHCEPKFDRSESGGVIVRLQTPDGRTVIVRSDSGEPLVAEYGKTRSQHEGRS